MLDALQPLIPFLELKLTAVYLIVVLTVIAFFREWGSPDLVALTAMGALLLLGILPLGDVISPSGEIQKGLLSVFGNGAPITIACMFVISAGLERTGVIDALGRFFTRIAGKTEQQVLLVVLLMGAGLSAFVNNTPIVVVFLPIVLAHARATNLKSSKLLIPLSFASILGGTCTLIGTSTNLIVDGVAQQFGQKPFGMFEISKLGLIYSAVGIVYLMTIGRKLLPSRSSLAELIGEQQLRSFLTQFEVAPKSALVGKVLTETLLKDFPTAQVHEVKRRGRVIQEPLNELKVRERDRILLSLQSSSFQRLMETDGIRFEEDKRLNLKKLEDRDIKLVEVIIGPRSTLVGRSIDEIGFRKLHGIIVLAIHRQGENLRKNFSKVRLQYGDTLLLEGPPDSIAALRGESQFISITDPPEVTVNPTKVWVGAGVTMAFVLGASFNLMGVPALAILAALAMILSRCVSAYQAYAAVQWNIVFLIFGMLALGLSLDQTGAARVLVDGIMKVCGSFSPIVILSIVYLLSSILTELISNNAVAALLTPIVIGIAENLGVDARPFIIALMFGCSASFATPIGYQTNTYVYGAGGYKFSDFPRVGIPLNLILWIVATFAIPWLWPFQ